MTANPSPAPGAIPQPGPRTMLQIADLLQRPTPVEAIRFIPKDVRADPGDPEKFTALALPYVDPRFVERRLDVACGGPLGWQTQVCEAAGHLCVGLGILNPETGAWVWRWDTGEDEPTNGGGDQPGGKAIITVGIKRCGYQFGIARDLFALKRLRFHCNVTKGSKGATFRGWTEEPRKAVIEQRQGRA